MRLTAHGEVLDCLFARDESDLRSLLRCGACGAEIADRRRSVQWGRRAGPSPALRSEFRSDTAGRHRVDDPAFAQPDRPMSVVGN